MINLEVPVYKGESSSICVNNYTWGCRGALVPRCLGFRTCFTKCDNCQIIVQIKSFNKGTMSQRLRSGQTQHKVANNSRWIIWVTIKRDSSSVLNTKSVCKQFNENSCFQEFRKRVWGGRGGGGDRGEKTNNHFLFSIKNGFWLVCNVQKCKFLPIFDQTLARTLPGSSDLHLWQSFEIWQSFSYRYLSPSHNQQPSQVTWQKLRSQNRGKNASLVVLA